MKNTYIVRWYYSSLEMTKLQPVSVICDQVHWPQMVRYT